MRVRAESLFQSAEALRKRVEELEQVVAEMHGALRLANDSNLYLAKRIKDLESLIGSRVWNDPSVPQGKDDV